MAPVIKIENLSKCYTLGEQVNFRTLRDTLMTAASALGRRLAPNRSKRALRPQKPVIWALDDICLEIERGDRVGIIGRNGAGKSTLLKILSRIVEPTRGRAEIRGRVASLLEVGTGFHLELTGRENVFLNGMVLGMTRAEIRKHFDEIVDFAEVGPFIDTPVKRYSSGMMVRLAFSVAAQLTPEILIVDEVLAVGDTEFQKKCLGVMRDVSTHSGRTVLFVSHSMPTVQALCTRGVYLDKGRIAKIGPAEEVVAAYLGNASVDLQLAPVSGHDFELCGLKVGSSNGAVLRTFAECLVEVNYRTLRDLVDAGVHVLFEDLNGAPVLGLYSADFVQRIRAQAGQTLTCNFRIQSLPLNPGPYRLRVWLRSDADNVEWEVPASFDVTVEQTAVYGAWEIKRNWHGTTAAVAQVTMGLASEMGQPPPKAMLR